MQALQDIGYKGEKKTLLSEKNQALAWIGSKDFQAWCETADMHPDDVRRKAREIEEKGAKWRAPAGQGIRYEERKKYNARKKAEALFSK